MINFNLNNKNQKINNKMKVLHLHFAMIKENPKNSNNFNNKFNKN